MRMMTLQLSNSSLAFVRKASRWAVGAAGILWVALAASLCGCSPVAPVNGWVMNESGQAYYRRGDYRSARREFERALMDRPESADYAFNVAAAMDRQGDKLAAEKMYRHALSLDPSHQPSYHGLASMMHESGRSPEANDLLTTWAATQPYMAEPYVELGWLKQEQGDMEGADRALTRALRNNPRHSKALAQLGRVKGRRGHSDEAAADFARSLYMDPHQPQVRQDLASMEYDTSMSPALQMAAMMPKYDPTMAGGFPAGNSMNYGSPVNGYSMSAPAMLSQIPQPAYGGANSGTMSHFGATSYSAPSYAAPASYPVASNYPVAGSPWNAPQASAPMNYSPTAFSSPPTYSTAVIPTNSGMVYPGAVPMGDPLASTYMTGTAPYSSPPVPTPAYSAPGVSNSPIQATSYYPQTMNPGVGPNDAPTWIPEASTGMPGNVYPPTMNANYGGSMPTQTSTIPVVPAF